MQIYGMFEGFPLTNSALFGLVSFYDPFFLVSGEFGKLEQRYKKTVLDISTGENNTSTKFLE